MDSRVGMGCVATIAQPMGDPLLLGRAGVVILVVFDFRHSYLRVSGHWPFVLVIFASPCTDLPVLALQTGLAIQRPPGSRPALADIRRKLVAVLGRIESRAGRPWLAAIAGVALAGDVVTLQLSLLSDPARIDALCASAGPDWAFGDFVGGWAASWSMSTSMCRHFQSLLSLLDSEKGDDPAGSDIKPPEGVAEPLPPDGASAGSSSPGPRDRAQDRKPDLDRRCESPRAVRQERDRDRPTDCLLVTEVEQVKRRQ
jgi:hypothetical protein